jgi:DNA-binding beta-propeller fold protein YncE
MRVAAAWPSVVALLLAGAGTPDKHHEPTYALRRTIPAAGDEAWDAATLDPEAHRLYVTRGNRVVVLDVRSERVVGEIDDTPGVHGIALATDVGRGFTTNGGDDSVTMFDLGKAETLGRIPASAGPDAILYDPFSRRVFAFGRKAAEATVVDAALGKAVGSIALGGRPVSAVSDRKGKVFVALENRNEIASFDPATLSIGNRWPLAPCEAPAGMAMDSIKGRIFVACRNRRMVVLDATTGAVTATVPVGLRADAVAFDEDRGLAFVAAGDGTMTIAREDPGGRFAVAQVVATQPGSHALSLDPGSHRIYVPACRFGAPPPPTKERPHPRASVAPGSFTILVFAR